MNPPPVSSTQEWIEADGLGGFASGTAAGVRTRRYHALLLTATTPPTGRLVLVNGLDAWVQTAQGAFALSAQHYAPDVISGDSAQHIEAFGVTPWPHWIFKLPDGTRIEQELFMSRGEPVTCISWKVLGPRRDVKLFVRPFLSGRDYHSLHKSNPGFNFDPQISGTKVCWRAYDGVPGVAALSNGDYSHQPVWYYNFLYDQERARGLDCEEDLAAPGVFCWNLAENKAALVLTTRAHAAEAFSASVKPLELLNKLREKEMKRRDQFPSRLHAAADAYIVERQPAPFEAEGAEPRNASPGKTIIAGYPWFTDWGRDTFIALRGLCLATGRLEDAREILLAWTDAVSEGMLPNRFPDQGGKPEFNAVDASLWFIIAADEYLQTAKGNGTFQKDKVRLLRAFDAILDGYSRGTRYGIRLEPDGLLAAGEPGVQLTWMDAKVGDWVVTPRIGKPVEVQALWLNALAIAGRYSDRWKAPLELGLQSFPKRFWNPERRCLYDVVDVGHQPGKVDASLRPNQVFAVGGLPLPLLQGENARLVIEACEDQLLTPVGLRSLGPMEPGYARQYAGGVWERDGAYHQGTVWPWLLGPFLEGWVRVRGGTAQAKKDARKRFLEPLLASLDEAGLGHISEITDAEPPYLSRGCPFQAWSLGEALRLDRIVLAVNESGQPRRKRELTLV